MTGASSRNWASYGADVDGELDVTERALLSDPQTSGGLLVACSRNAVDEVLQAFTNGGFDRAAVVGEIVPGPAAVAVAGSAKSVRARVRAVTI